MISDTGQVKAGIRADLDDLEILYDDINDYLEAGTNYTGWIKGIYPTREDAEAGIQGESLFLLRSGGRIAGSLILNGIQEEAYAQAPWGLAAEAREVMVVHTLVVHPDFMKQGISRQLLAFAKSHAQNSGAKTLRLDVAEQNLPAIALYEKSGYRYVGTVDLGYAHLKWFRLYELVL